MRSPRMEAAECCVRRYAQTCALLDKLQDELAMPSSFPRRKTEEDALARVIMGQIPAGIWREYSTVKNTIQEIHATPDGEKRMFLIAILYGDDEERTLEEAAKTVRVDTRTARRWQEDFLSRVASKITRTG